MNAFECYKTYLALKQHFTKDSYDYHKYGGKVNASKSTFESRRDKYYFAKLANKRDITNFILSNMIVNPSVWVGELVGSDEAEEHYKKWLKTNQSLSYTFKEEINSLSIDNEFNQLFKFDGYGHPLIVRMYMRDEISLETLIILMDLTDRYSVWDKKMEYDPVWSELSMKIRKYKSFINYDVDKYRKIVIDTFS